MGRDRDAIGFRDNEDQNTHVRRYHQHYQSSGHIWQGRFKAFPIEADAHLLTVLRYVERIPLRANLAEQAEQWLWSSARHGIGHAIVRQGNVHANDVSPDRPSWLAAGPVKRPKDWLRWVNQPLLTAAQPTKDIWSVTTSKSCRLRSHRLKRAAQLSVTPAELDALRRSVNRGAPYGSSAWVEKSAEEMGLQATLRPRGRPKNATPAEGE